MSKSPWPKELKCPRCGGKTSKTMKFGKMKEHRRFCFGDCDFDKNDKKQIISIKDFVSKK
jgi:hypothetical protein